MKNENITLDVGQEQLNEFLQKQNQWEFKIVEYKGSQYEVPKTMKYMYINHNEKWNTTILYTTSEKPVWDSFKRKWRKNKGAMELEVRPFEGVIPFLASKASLSEI